MSRTETYGLAPKLPWRPRLQPCQVSKALRATNLVRHGMLPSAYSLASTLSRQGKSLCMSYNQRFICDTLRLREQQEVKSGQIRQTYWLNGVIWLEVKIVKGLRHIRTPIELLSYNVVEAYAAKGLEVAENI